MGKQRIKTPWLWNFQFGGWKKKKEPPEKIHADVVCLLLLCIMIASKGASGWEEGDDSVNVISVENMDALLRLRMVTELNLSDDFANATESEQRLKRGIYGKKPKYPPPTGSQVTPLCSRTECKCDLKSGYLNVTCDFQSREVLDLGPGSLPGNLLELHVTNLKELKILPGAFSDHPNLVAASFRKMDNLSIRNQAFHNLSKSSFYLEIKDCQVLILEEHSFHNLRNPLRAIIENCHNVTMKRSVFSWLLELEIKNVPIVELVESTFSMEKIGDPQSTGTTITFQNVTINQVPNATFPSSVSKIRFIDCSIESIRTGAFSAVELTSVSFEKTELKRLENGAFSDKTLIKTVEFVHSKIQHIASNSLTAANNLTIENSRIGEIIGDAFRVKIAFITLSKNVFRKIHRHAFDIQEWNSIVIDENRFEDLQPDSIQAPFTNTTTIKNRFYLTDNVFAKTEVDALSFIPNDSNLDVRIAGNKFLEPCHCHLGDWIHERSSTKGDQLYETSFCLVNELLARCYNLEKGYMRMANYTSDICGNASKVVCEESSRSYRPNVLTELDLENTERTVLGVIFLGVTSSVCIMLFILSAMWMKQKGVCGRMQRYLTPSGLSFVGIFSRLFNNTSLVTTASISRINIHEYAEIQNQINQQQKHTILTMDEEGSDDEELIIYEDKATQTLPEELTQELLQSLREKLDDPENYNEARDMIEHLYDLIKVEESCNNNSTSPRTSFLFDEEETVEEEGGNIYDVIQPRRQLTRKNSKRKRKNSGVSLTTIGTRTPSLDKLLPVNYNAIRPPPTVINEYLEPRDRKSNEYCELPGSSDANMPDVLATSNGPTSKPFNCLRNITDRVQKPSNHVYAEPITSNMINRPLPNKPDQPGTSYS